MPIVINTQTGIRLSTPPLECGAHVQREQPPLLTEVALPSAMPHLRGIRNPTSGVMTVLAAEMIGAKAGLGSSSPGEWNFSTCR